MTFVEAVVKRIVELCAERNISINKMGVICGIRQSTLNNIIHAGAYGPTVLTIKKICDGMEITLCEFFDTDYFNKLEQEIR